ncbi:MAG: protein-glutamate O-methyltransferase CheR [Dehalococcoidia bacterium]
MPPQNIADGDYTTFIRKVRGLTGIDLSDYKPDQMRRRLLALAGRFGETSLANFAGRMERDPAAMTAFQGFFTINVSEFLRDASRWDDLATQVLPGLVKGADRRPFRVWSAGCSIGAEPYSLAMLLEEVTPARPYAIFATDIDEAILARARQGSGYQEAELRNVSAARRTRFFEKDAAGVYRVKAALKAHIRFLRQDLLTSVPDRDLDLIVCRNVTIYFTEEAKRALYQRMAAALRPGGILFVGGTEVITAARDLGLEPFRTSFYRRGAAQVAVAA